MEPPWGETGINVLGWGLGQGPYQGVVKVSETQSSKRVDPHVLRRGTRRTGIEEGVPHIAQEPRSRSLAENSYLRIFSPPQGHKELWPDVPSIHQRGPSGYR